MLLAGFNIFVFVKFRNAGLGTIKPMIGFFVIQVSLTKIYG
jgi:hypothetical protein